MKIKIEGYVSAWHFGDPRRTLDDFNFYEGPMEDTDSRIALCPYTVEVDVDLPETDELTQRVVLALRKQKDAIYVHAAEQAERVQDRIERLLALTNEVPAQTVEEGDDIPF